MRRNESGQRAVGIDVGGTKIEGSLFDRTGRVLRTLRRATPASEAATLDVIVEIVDRLAGEQNILGVGFSIPGGIDPQTGLLRNAPNSPGINGTPLAANLNARLGVPTAFENDANCLLLAETLFGAAKGKRHVVAIILGTGIGAGVLVDGRLLTGSRGLAPEPGHIPLDVHGRPCRCGNRGCVEAHLSGPSMVARYREAGGEADPGSAKDLFQKTGDPAAKRILAETADLFARFIAALCALYDPQCFVLGGGLSLQPMYYRQGGKIANYLFGSREAPPILPAKGGDAAGKLGAASLIFNGQNLR